MAKDNVHTLMINRAAREALRPLGLKQKGRSRFWIDDRAWHAIIVEFQPSGWARGSYLNIAVSWFWHPKDHWTFDLGYREMPFVEFRSEDQFAKALTGFVGHTEHRVAELRQQFSTLSKSLAHAEQAYRDRLGSGGWPDLHTGILAVLAGNIDAGTRLMSGAFTRPAQHDWQQEVVDFSTAGLANADCAFRFRRWAESHIAVTRSLLGLPRLEGDSLPLA